MRMIVLRVCVGISLLISPRLRAATVSVCDEAGFRAALATGAAVTFACDGTIILSNTVSIADDAIIDGSGRNVTLSGNGAVRIFHVAQDASLQLRGVTLANGYSTSGGAVFNEGTLVLDRCQLTNNTAQGWAGTNGVIGTDGGIQTEGGPIVVGPGGPGGDGGPGTLGAGGAIFSTASLFVTNSTFAGNRAQGGTGGAGGKGGPGGRVFDQFGRCRFGYSGGVPGQAGMGGTGSGGAIFNATSGSAFLHKVTFMGNIAEGGTGGLGGLPGDGGCSAGRPTSTDGGVAGNGRGGSWFNAGTLTATESIGLNNRASGGRGGTAPDDGIGFIPAPGGGGDGGRGDGGLGFNEGTARLVQIIASGNEARGGDGGFGGRANFAGCPAKGGNGGNGSGGALYEAGETSLLGATIWNNAATGGIATNHFGILCVNPIPLDRFGTNGMAFGSSVVNANSFKVRTSILGGPNTLSNCAGILADEGHNLCSDDSAGFSHATSRNRLNPDLVALGTGASFVLSPRRGSPAIDTGDDSAPLTVDQRGVPRPQGTHADIGAVEATFLIIEQGSPGVVQLRYVGAPGVTYSLEAANELGGSWQQIQSRDADEAGQVIFTDLAISSELPRFFRVADASP